MFNGRRQIMFGKVFRFGGVLLLSGAAALVTPDRGQAQHGGGHGGGAHFEGRPGGTFHGGTRFGGVPYGRYGYRSYYPYSGYSLPYYDMTYPYTSSPSYDPADSGSYGVVPASSAEMTTSGAPQAGYQALY